VTAAELASIQANETLELPGSRRRSVRGDSIIDILHRLATIITHHGRENPPLKTPTWCAAKSDHPTVCVVIVGTAQDEAGIKELNSQDSLRDATAPL